MNPLRKDFLERIKNIEIEKEPKTEEFELTEEEIESQLDAYKKLLKSDIINKVMSEGEER